MADRKGYEGGIVWPLVLIAAGVILLLNNLGISEISLMEVALKTWPALLIGFGLELLIPRQSFWGSLTAFLTVIAVFGASYWLMTTNQSGTIPVAQFSQPIGDASRAEITIDQRVGILNIAAAAAPEALVAASIQTQERYQPDREFQNLDGAAHFELVESRRQFWPIPMYPGSRQWDVDLNTTVPMDLAINLGVGLARFDLDEMKLDSLEAGFGVGRMVVELPGGQVQAVTIDGGVGEVLVIVPVGGAFEFQLDRGLTTLQYPASFELAGSRLRSISPKSEQRPVPILIDMGVGRIRIEER